MRGASPPVSLGVRGSPEEKHLVGDGRAALSMAALPSPTRWFSSAAPSGVNQQHLPRCDTTTPPTTTTTRRTGLTPPDASPSSSVSWRRSRARAPHGKDSVTPLQPGGAQSDRVVSEEQGGVKGTGWCQSDRVVSERQGGVRGTGWCQRNRVVMEEQGGVRGTGWCQRNRVVSERQGGVRGTGWCQRNRVVMEEQGGVKRNRW
ncbi:unnamed protein product [Gadus morhua 'NCC']